MTTDWGRLAADLTGTLHLASPPIAITFSAAPPPEVAPFDAPMAPPAADGRTGRVPAGCVFWIKAADRTFSTVAEDHGNCSVGSLTHGFIDLPTAATRPDVAALVAAGWVTEDVFPSIPVVDETPGAVTYGPLAQTPIDPDVVLLRINGQQAMVLSDAIPGLAFEGKPQCHIVAMAKAGRPAASVGCALSRARTGMPATEMTCAFPAGLLPGVIRSLQANAEADATVARYAAADATRFAP